MKAPAVSGASGYQHFVQNRIEATVGIEENSLVMKGAHFR